MFSTRKRLIAWVLFGAVAIAGVGAAAVEYVHRYASALEAIDKTLAVERATSETLSLLKDAETGQRGFVLTGEPEFLAPHGTAAGLLPAQLRRLQVLVAASPEQAASAARLATAAEAKLALLEKTISLREQERTAEAMAVIKEGRGRRLMDQARAEVRNMLRRERQLLSRREAEAESGLRRLVAILVGSWLLLIAAVAGGVWSAARGLKEGRRAAEAVQDSERAMRALAENASDLVYVLGNDMELLYVSPSCERILGFTREEMLAMPTGALLPEEERETARLLGEQVRSGTAGKERNVHRLRTKDGSYRWFESSFRLVSDPAEGTQHIHLTSRDITERRLFEQELQESEERLRLLTNASFEGVAISKGRVVIDVNDTFAAWLGRSREELMGVDGLTLFALEDREHARHSSSDTASYEARLLGKDGSVRHVEVRGLFMNYRGEQVRIAVVRDISDRFKREAALKEHADLMRVLSLRDELTGLYNRRGFTEIGEPALRALARSSHAGCIFFIDLDGLKVINDVQGHEAGDRVIAAAAKVLTDVFRDSDVVARLGGDEFAVLALECGLADIPSVLDRIAAHVAASNQSQPELALSMSIGTALFEPPALPDFNALMDQADHAMYEQKRFKQRRSA